MEFKYAYAGSGRENYTYQAQSLNFNSLSLESENAGHIKHMHWVSREKCILINIKYDFVKICFFLLGIGGTHQRCVARATFYKRTLYLDK